MFAHQTSPDHVRGHERCWETMSGASEAEPHVAGGEETVPDGHSGTVEHADIDDMNPSRRLGSTQQAVGTTRRYQCIDAACKNGNRGGLTVKRVVPANLIHRLMAHGSTMAGLAELESSELKVNDFQL